MTYIAPAKATKIYNEICKTYGVKCPKFSHYVRYYCINFPSFTEALKCKTENNERWALAFIAEREKEWAQIREKRYR